MMGQDWIVIPSNYVGKAQGMIALSGHLNTVLSTVTAFLHCFRQGLTITNYS
jgi:hypothetical protein